MLKKILLGLLIAILIIAIGGVIYYRTAIYVKPLISDKDRAAVNIMPLPATMEIKKGTLTLAKGINIEYTGIENEYLKKSVQRFFVNVGKTKNVTSSNNGVLLKINCLEKSLTNIPQLYDDESYSLQISDEIILSANTEFGINHGLESVLQLIQLNTVEASIPKLKIEDNPRFAWRGIMLDACRHWMPKQVVLETLDAMAAVKMNVFHWHLSEDQGFRVESKVFPKLHEIGSNGKYYTQAEIHEIVAYAAERGIRIIPEFDVPGHSKSWQIAYPELSTLSKQLSFASEPGEIFQPPLDPTKEYVYNFLDQLIAEMATLFPDHYFHIGGDEVNPKYWNESDSVQAFMKKNGIKDAHQLQSYFNSRIYKLVKKHGKIMVGWDEILNENLEDDVVIQSWRGHKTLFESVQNGNKAILSAGWYLDHKLHSDKHYSVDPLTLPGAIDFEPDTTQWKTYSITLEVPSGELDGKLVVFDKNPNDICGLFQFVGNTAGFKNGTIKDNLLSFEMESQMGKFNFEAELLADSLSGKISVAILNFEANGKLMEGSHSPGAIAPKFEVIKPLTTEQESLILGGEAAMWSEVVGANNVASRIWPRSATIAEKLWSSAELTTNTEDMYRRLREVSTYLSQRGNPHQNQQKIILKQLIAPEGLQYLEILVDVLEEVKYYGRMASIGDFTAIYLPDLKLDGVVDAARPESFSAYNFNRLVDAYLLDKNNLEIEQQIQKQLMLWSLNHKYLKPYLGSEQLVKVENLSNDLSLVSDKALEVLESGKNLNAQNQKQVNEMLVFLEAGENGMVCAVAKGLRKLCE